MKQADIIIIGSGPGGMEMCSCALSQGKNVILIENDKMGGTCLNKGCIPTKALCKSAEVVEIVKNAHKYGITLENVVPDFASAVERKDSIVSQMRKNVEIMLSKATVINGEAVFVDASTVQVGEEQFSAPVIIVATGSKPAMLPIEGAELCVDSTFVLDSKVLPERICIVGGGVIGMELARILNAYGVDVTVVEFCSEILPNFDKEVAKRLRSMLNRKGVKILVSAAVTSVKQGFVVNYTTKGKEMSLDTDMVLMAVGRKPVIPKGLEEVGVKTSRKGIEVDTNYATNIPGIYAIGDCNGEMMLAHVAEAQARVISGEAVNMNVVPADVFTDPECAMVGLTQEQCVEKQLPIKISKSLFRANGKANAMDNTDGFVKIIVNSETQQILGCHIIGPHASDLIQEIANAMATDTKVSELATVIHAHPTLSETVLAAIKSVVE